MSVWQDGRRAAAVEMGKRYPKTFLVAPWMVRAFLPVVGFVVAVGALVWVASVVRAADAPSVSWPAWAVPSLWWLFGPVAVGLVVVVRRWWVWRVPGRFAVHRWRCR